MFNRIGILYFSPTNTTLRVCTAIASGIGDNNPKYINITLPHIRAELINNPKNFTANIDHLIVGAPVYTGKLPLQVIECLEKIDGYGIKATAIVVYGNRDYGIALRKMVEILSTKNFKVTSAGAFIGQHSYSDLIPVAIGRPDDKDIEAAYEFGVRISNINQPITSNNVPVQLDMFSKSKKYTPLVPVFFESNCSNCGICSEYCPTEIISSETGDFISEKAKKECIGCMACVYNCENNARILKPNFINRFMVKWVLKKASQTRVEPLTISS